MDRVTFRDLPDIEGIELRLQNFERLMRDEREQLLQDIKDASIKLFGLTGEDTIYPPDMRELDSFTQEAWDKHFEFLSEEWDEEDAFWDAFGIDLTDGDGEYLHCYGSFARQLICALKGLHPAASLKFRPGSEKSDSQIEAEAEAWAKNLLQDWHRPARSKR